MIGVAVLAIGTAFAASALGVSVALGAFVAGLALADSDLTASVLGEIVPLRELFSTFFFVSIGILLQPAAVLAAWPVVLTLLLIITLGKALPIAGLALLDGQRPSSALRAGALIGQSGEFSFVLASAGLGVAPSRRRPSRWPWAPSSCRSWRRARSTSARPGWGSGSTPSCLPRSRAAATIAGARSGMRRHAVILGYGRIGRSVARVLDSRGFAWVAVDSDYGVARDARSGGAPVIFGDAGTPSVLDQAGVTEAHAMIVAMSDALATRQALTYARSRNARIEVVARAHSDAEEADLRTLGAARVVVADRELGNELIRHALRRFGVSDREVAAFLEAPRGEAECSTRPRLADALDELVQRADHEVRDAVGVLVQQPPWASPDPHRAHAGCGGRSHVVVDPITDVGNRAGVRRAEQLQGAREEGRIRLGDAHRVAHAHGVDVDAERLELGVAAGRLIGGHCHAVAALLEAGDGAQRIGIEVIGPKRAVALVELRLVRAPLGLLDELEEPAPRLWLVGIADGAAEDRHQREVGQAEDLGPGVEDAGLVDQGLAHVEDHPSCHRRSTSHGRCA